MKESNKVLHARVQTAGPQSRSIFSINTANCSTFCPQAVFFFFLRLAFPGGVLLLLFSHSILSDSQSVRHYWACVCTHTTLLHNVVLVFAVQQSEWTIRIHIFPLFWISFPFRSPQSTLQFPALYNRSSLVIVCIVKVKALVAQSCPTLRSHGL